MTTLLLLVPSLVKGATDPVPAPEDVKAGWIALIVFIALAVAVVVLGVSLTRHLRKARASADEGLFDPSDPPRPRHF